jgi:hypothetical protein
MLFLLNYFAFIIIPLNMAQRKKFDKRQVKRTQFAVRGIRSTELTAPSTAEPEMNVRLPVVRIRVYDGRGIIFIQEAAYRA